MSLKAKLKSNVISDDLLPQLDTESKYANTVMIHVASMLREERNMRDMTQCEFANLCGVSQPMVCQWENGDYNVSIKTLAIIAHKLGVELNITFDDNKDLLSIDANSYELGESNLLRKPVELGVAA